MTPLQKLRTLTLTEQTAFVALFAGARLTAQVAKVGNIPSGTRLPGEVIAPSWGKAECGWVDDWHDFYSRKLPELGLTTWHEEEPRPALGMAEGSTCWNVSIGITDEGHDARDAYWDALKSHA